MRKTPLNSGDKAKLTIRERDNHTCQLCNIVWDRKRKMLDVHHLNKGKEGFDGRMKMKEFNPKRLITLCHKCHLNLPQTRLKMAKSDWSKEIARRIPDPFTDQIRQRISEKGKYTNGVLNVVWD